MFLYDYWLVIMSTVKFSRVKIVFVAFCCSKSHSEIATLRTAIPLKEKRYIALQGTFWAIKSRPCYCKEWEFSILYDNRSMLQPDLKLCTYQYRKAFHKELFWFFSLLPPFPLFGDRYWTVGSLQRRVSQKAKGVSCLEIQE